MAAGRGFPGSVIGLTILAALLALSRRPAALSRCGMEPERRADGDRRGHLVITSGRGTPTGPDETIRVALTFSEAVDVNTAGGTPRLKIDMDPADWGEKWASVRGRQQARPP